MEPQRGFYYHYKHDPHGPVNNYAYEVMGIAHHTEIAGLTESAMVMYRPLYDAPVYAAGKHWDVRPLEMFMENVSKDNQTIPRFRKIHEAAVSAELEKIRDSMYN